MTDSLRFATDKEYRDYKSARRLLCDLKASKNRGLVVDLDTYAKLQEIVDKYEAKEGEGYERV